MDALIGECIQRKRLLNLRYEPIRFLGRGGMGWVVSARDSLLKEEVVVLKFLYPHVLQSEALLRRFKSEVLLARRLIHPHIVRTHNFCTDEEFGHNIVMEYVEGQTLRTRLYQAELPEIPLLHCYHILQQLLSSIAHAHQLGVVHLDLKPENVLLNESGDIRLLDFGLAQTLRRNEERSTSMLGTPQYMAPEQFEAGMLDQRTDIYSLGILCFELLTRTLPFEGSTIFNLAEQHLSQPLPLVRLRRKEAPEWLQSFLEKCCAKSKEERFQNVAEMLDAFQKQQPDLRVEIALPQVLERQDREGDFLESSLRFWRKRSTRIAFSVILLLAFIYYGRSMRWLRQEIIFATFLVEKNLGVHLAALHYIFDFPIRADQSLFTAYSMEGIEALVRVGADTNEKQVSDGRTMLFVLMQSPNNLEEVKLFLEYGADPNLQDRNGETALFLIRGESGVPRLELLLRYGANINLRDASGESALFAAVRRQDYPMTRAFLKAGARVDFVNKSGETVFDAARVSGDRRIEELLLNARNVM